MHVLFIRLCLLASARTRVKRRCMYLYGRRKIKPNGKINENTEAIELI